MSRDLAERERKRLALAIVEMLPTEPEEAVAVLAYVRRLCTEFLELAVPENGTAAPLRGRIHNVIPFPAVLAVIVSALLSLPLQPHDGVPQLARQAQVAPLVNVGQRHPEGAAQHIRLVNADPLPSGFPIAPLARADVEAPTYAGDGQPQGAAQNTEPLRDGLPAPL